MGKQVECRGREAYYFLAKGAWGKDNEQNGEGDMEACKSQASLRKVVGAKSEEKSVSRGHSCCTSDAASRRVPTQHKTEENKRPSSTAGRRGSSVLSTATGRRCTSCPGARGKSGQRHKRTHGEETSQQGCPARRHPS